jgi:hypothetical protein
MAEEVHQVVKGPYLIPAAWVWGAFTLLLGNVAMIIAVGIWSGTISTKVEAQASEVTRLRDWRTDVSGRFGSIETKVTRIETMMEFAFPEAAKRASKSP